MPNRLANETSPYLLQHANNPVDWFAWNGEALEKAKNEDKPIFLSIGYSACHWCHVMEHESFEDQSIAAYLNENFVSIKVDREERPDLDHIYMQAVMAIRGGQGGWPLSAFLTPDCQVFFGGTYWPPRNRIGMPGFDNVIRQVRGAFDQQRDAITDQASRITQWLNETIQTKGDGEKAAIDESILVSAAGNLEANFDFQNGGFGNAPKFPHTMDLQLLLRLATHLDHPDAPSKQRMLEMVELNLNKMAAGGIHDHLGGGFCRYSVDEKWLVPHFEKMLYDNAQLIRLYAETFLATKNETHHQAAAKTIDYLLNYMLDEAGAFHSSEDADSEGVEGKFYVWMPDEIKKIIGDEQGELFCKLYDVSEHGNFEGKNILNLPIDFDTFAKKNNIDQSDLRAEMLKSREQLLEHRDQRIRPAKDDKILTSWNASALEAILHHRLFGLLPAITNEQHTCWLDFAASKTVDGKGRLQHSYRHGRIKINAFLDDYAYLLNALCTDSTDTQSIQRAAELANEMIDLFWDERNGGFFFTPADQTDVITRYKDHHDGSVPSGNGMAAYALIRLHRITGNSRWLGYAEKSIQWSMPYVERSPLACGQMLLAIDLLLAKPTEFIVIENDKDSADEIMSALKHRWLPYATFVRGDINSLEECVAIDPSVYEGKTAIDGQSSLYICSGYHCEQPLTDLSDISRRLDELEVLPG
jgi:uncharacterized protein YyaL (SSP411 family)